MYALSVVVPVYNTAKYIERCARSLFEQSLKNIEFIFVDDGSSDESLGVLEKVIEKYPNRKSHVRILRHEKNLGTLCTKLDGLVEATGEYFIVCDSDDWVDKDAYQTMYEMAHKIGADIVTCDYLKEFDDHHLYCKHDPSPYNRGVDIVANSYLTAFEWQECTGIFRNRQDILSKVSRIEGLCMWDDVYVAILLFYFSNHVVHIAKPYYHYDRTFHGSVSENKGDQRWRDQKQVVDKLHDFLKDSCPMTLHWLELDTVVPYIMASGHLKWIDVFPGCQKYIGEMKLWPFYWRWAYGWLAKGQSLPCRLTLLAQKTYKCVRHTSKDKT